MKKLFALLLVLIMPLALAACGGKEGTGSGGASKSGGKTPSPKFSGAYQYNPPKDTYFIKWQDFDAAGKEDGNADIYARIGGGCSYGEEGTSVYHASDEQQKYYERAWEGEYSDWMVSQVTAMETGNLTARNPATISAPATPLNITLCGISGPMALMRMKASWRNIT